MMFFSKKRNRLFFFGAACFFSLGLAVRLLFPEEFPVFSAVREEQGSIVYVLDAGHGGEDGGAVSADGDKESDINLSVAQKLDALLRFLGRNTLMTRMEDISIHSAEAETLRQKKSSDLKNRVALVNETHGARLVSIHQNSLPSVPSVHGAQVFYNDILPGEEYAVFVQAALNLSVNTGNEKHEKKIDPSIYLMKNVTAPAILVECGFMSNAAESKQLKESDYQRTLAVAIAAGILSAEEREIP